MPGKKFFWRVILFCGYSLSFFPFWALGADHSTAVMEKEKFPIAQARRAEGGKKGEALQKEKELIAQARKFPLMTVQSIKEGVAITLLALNLFDAEIELTSDGKDLLDQVGALLRNYPYPKIVVKGHTDSTGSAEINQAVSRKRANQVREYLVAYQEVPPGRIFTQGLGPSRPVATNATEAGRALNRRVEIVVLTGD
jgi:outer membrane protein OmpA-like peptidoglycan-associated protein